ncbi:hypothetical protein [Pelomonas sp. KK5]|uniref:hypothetical protein n=1 Tax=Pelomonas sp. KK5 TaxID=1855730 RepID=UPI00117E4B46|nr:hypothetical protein [Pelomonas sp. KK5]
MQLHKHVMALGENVSYPGPFGRTNTGGRIGSGGFDSDNYYNLTNDGSNYDGTTNPAGVVVAETRSRNVALLYCIKL